jgi:VIT1/CCC1 family predicted Fe2+/Mn2+ transporter
MPAKTGASHAVASFTTIILGAFISNYLSAHSSVLWGLTQSVGGTVTSVVGLDLPEVMTGVLVVATMLSFVWGVAYHFSRHGPGDGDRVVNRPWHE